MAKNEDLQNEKWGSGIVGITWILFAIRFLAVVSLIALALLYFLGKPLWIAPVIAVALFIVYRLCFRLVFYCIGRVAGKQESGSQSSHLASKRHADPEPVFDPEKQEAVIQASICTGEKVAGFKDKDGGHFTEVMLIRTDADLERFKKLYGITEVKTEY